MTLRPVSDDIDNLWFRRFRSEPPTGATKLICFPHAGGWASFYAPLARALPFGVDVLAVQYPGRMDRKVEPRIEDADELSELILEALRPALTGPYAFFGHSMGAVLAFEVARRHAARTGSTPVRLFVSGRRAPSVDRTESTHTLDDAGLRREIQLLDGTDSSLLEDEDFLAMILPSLRSDYRLVERYRYRPGPALPCPITALIGGNDPRVTVAEARAWKTHTSRNFHLQEFTGGHFYLRGNEPGVAVTVVAGLTG
jgi:surfactin synthase thioesterase subunit